MLNSLKKEVCKANIKLSKYGLAMLTWGNVSGIDRKKGLVVIKPSGVPYKRLTPEKMIIVDFDGNVVEGKGKPSSDTATHIRLYEAFEHIGGIVHTHSTYAAAFAQAALPIPVLGTTHADYFFGDIPITRAMTDEEINELYEYNTANIIIEANINPMEIQAVLVKNHGPFTWGKTPKKALENALVLEELAKMAFLTKDINSKATKVNQALLERHYLRKHGKDAYYGQTGGMGDPNN